MSAASAGQDDERGPFVDNHSEPRNASAAGLTPNRFSGSALADSTGGDGGSSVASSWAPPPGSTEKRPRKENRGTGTAALEPTLGSPHRFSNASSSRGTPATPAMHPPARMSLQDQIVAAASATGSNALFGTLELLKLAGGATLSTTGKLVAPPLHVTRTVLLPTLWAAFVDYVSHTTPLRVKDWFRIVSSSVHHFVTVLKNTHRGKVFREKVVTVGSDIMDCVSSDASRQAIMDGMACVVKLSEALHTPEMKALLEQLSVLGCRIVDAASSGRNKKLLHDVSDATWAGLELISDPSATLALAEVTAYLCHALEMEDSLHREKPVAPKKAAQRRYQRNQYQKQTYVDPNLIQDVNSSVEQVILSSLGAPADDASLPRHVVLNPTPMDYASTTENEKYWLHHEEDDPTGRKDGVDWRDDVDLEFLQERISIRAAQLESKRKPQTPRKGLRSETTNLPPLAHQGPDQNSIRSSGNPKTDIEDLIVTTVHDDDDETHDEPSLGPSQTTPPTESSKVVIGLRYDETSDAPDTAHLDDPIANESYSSSFPPRHMTYEDESASMRFYRALDEIMTKQRAVAVDAVLATQLDDSKPDNARTGLSWYPKAAAAAGAGNERGQDTIKHRVAMVRQSMMTTSEIGVGHKAQSSGKDGKWAEGSGSSQKESNSSLLAGCVLIGVIMVWFAFGCYGIYAMLTRGDTININPSPHLDATQEVIVRIVRPVIDATNTGDIIEKVMPSVLPSQITEEIALCIATAFQ